MSVRFSLLLLPVALATPLAAQVNVDGIASLEQVTLSIGMGKYARAALGSGDALRIVNITGTIHVTGTDGDSIIYHYAPPADAEVSRANMSPGIRVERTATGMTIQRDTAALKGIINLTVKLPRNLKRLDLEVTERGGIAVDGFDGALTVTNRSGSIVLEHLRGPLSVAAPRGDIRAIFDDLPPATSPGITLLGSGGNIILTLPASSNAEVKLETQNGRIFSDFIQTGLGGRMSLNSQLKSAPPPVGPFTSASTSYFSNGGKGPKVRVETISGSIIVTKSGPDPRRP